MRSTGSCGRLRWIHQRTRRNRGDIVTRLLWKVRNLGSTLQPAIDITGPPVVGRKRIAPVAILLKLLLKITEATREIVGGVPDIGYTHHLGGFRQELGETGSARRVVGARIEARFLVNEPE